MLLNGQRRGLQALLIPVGIQMGVIIGLSCPSGIPCFGFVVPRTGFVTLQFDDTHDYDYTRIFPKLEQYGFKASFGYITEASDLGIEHEPWKIQEMYNAGHEIQDHTTRHDYMWATHVDTLDDGVTEWISLPLATVAQWDSLCRRSRDILDSLGISAAGWNQPGGGYDFGEIPGHPGWASKTDTCYSMYNLMAGCYSYALGFGVNPNTAHLNLRGHNSPDCFPVFNVPHVTIDYRTLSDVKSGIADAVASGLWYLAACHPWCLENVCKAETLIDWLAEKNVEILTCGEGVERIWSGCPDPQENQLPQAAMLVDLDGNWKPDGFSGRCTWDTVSAPPVAGVRCLRLGTGEFYCYGPFTGISVLSLWMKSMMAPSSTAEVECVKLGFGWEWLGTTVTTVSCMAEWTKADTLTYPSLAVDVGDEVDRIRFTVRSTGPLPILMACPEFIHVPGTGAGIGPSPGSCETPRLSVFPSPVRIGDPLQVRSTYSLGRVTVHDVLGRCLLVTEPRRGQSGITVDTRRFAPGILFLMDSSSPRTSAKVMAYR